jgi:carbon-monoxide dehydrogenase catalytic subunit
LHAGSCVDNSRILTACAEIIREGGLGDSFDKLPVAGAAPEWMSEKAIAIGMYFVASGIFVVIGQSLPVEGSQPVTELLTKSFEKHFGANWAFEPDPVRAAHLMIDHIDRKRRELGLPPPMHEVPYPPKTVEAAAPSRMHAAIEPMPALAASCPGPMRVEE